MLKKERIASLFLTMAVIIFILFPVAVADASPTITRLAGYDRYDTASEIAKVGWTKSNYVLLAYGENHPDALAAAPLAYMYDAPILLTRSNSLPEITRQTIKDLQVKNVIIIGGTGVIYAPVEAELNALGLNVTRVFGYDRYDTAIEVAKKITASAASTELFVVTGEDYADALSVGSIAAFKQTPIILVPRNSVPSSVKDYLSMVNVSKSYIIGNSDIISDQVSYQFPKSERILGADKYARNIAILEKFDSEFNSNSICIATGEVFADALTGAAYCAKIREPIMLISDSPHVNTKSYYMQKAIKISKEFVLGGTGVIPESVIQNLIYETYAPIRFAAIPYHTVHSGATNFTTEMKDNYGGTQTNVETTSFTRDIILDGQYQKLSGTIFRNFERRDHSNKPYIKIYCDDRLVYEKTINIGDKPADFSIGLENVTILKIECRVQGTVVGGATTIGGNI